MFSLKKQSVGMPILIYSLRTLSTKSRLVYNRYPSTKQRIKIINKIDKPSYYLTGKVAKIADKIPSDPQNLNKRTELIKEAGGFAGYLRYFASSIVKEGVTTEEIAHSVLNEAVLNDFYPAALHYKGFPSSVSISVNEVACHGIPDTRSLQNGDLVKIDCMSYLKGYFGDCCGTFIVGKTSLKNEILVETAKQCLEEAIKIVGPDVPFSEIGNIIEKRAKRENLTIIPEYAGHGIGKNLHDKPFVFHFKDSPDQGKMVKGMTFTIEPILTTGDGKTTIWPDKWSVVTIDGHLCAQFEETIVVTENGAEILTRYYNVDGENEYKTK